MAEAKTSVPSLNLSQALRGLLGALAGASVGAMLSAWLDARAARAASGALGLVLACWGVVAPLALPIAALVWGFRLIFSNAEAWSPRRLLNSLVDLRGTARAAWVATPLAAALLALVFLLAASGVATRLLGADLSGAAAFAMPPLSVLPLAVALLAGARLISKLSVRLNLERMSPALGVALAALAFGLGLGLLIALGETGGGGGPWRVLGVLRRQELDLRAPGMVLLLAACSLLGPSPLRPGAMLLAGLLVVVPAWATLQAARGSTLDESSALLLERHAPLGRQALSLLRKWTDRDRDGVSAAFAGGDCDDRDPGVSPRAFDVPGNGRDEDCQGGDARPITLPPATASTAKAEASSRLPGDLNLLLVTIDTLRADLGLLPDSRPVAPNLERLARQGVLFERAYSLASYTGKSMGPLMIGKYSSELDGGLLHFNKYSRRERFVQERLKAAGVRTISVQGYWYFFKDAGFERGFDVIDTRAAPKVAAIEGDQSSNSDEMCDAAIEQLAAPELEHQRFFMWMHLVDPHAEYAHHPEYDFGPKPRDRYQGEVAFVDAQLGRLLDALEKLPFGARTAVVVTSDHGEAFGEHGMIRHGFELWEELVRVPLIVRVPGIASRRVRARRSAIDLVPTILDIFKVPLPAPGSADRLSGESLMPDLLRDPLAPDPERSVFIDMARGPHNAERQAFIEGDLKLTVSDGRTLGLYDLKQDPDEKRDLSSQKALLQPMRDALAAFKSRLRPLPMPAQ